MRVQRQRAIHLAISGLLVLSFPLEAMAQLPALQPLPTSPAQRDEGYILGAGDRLRIDIFNIPEYSGETRVLVDGTLNLPVIGIVPVQGLSIAQATQILSTRYATILRRPLLTLSLVEARPITVAIAGEVNRPGSYTLSLTDTAGVPTLTKALQLAGGITQAANIREVQIRRLRPNQSNAELLTVNLWNLLQAGDLRQDLALRDGDTIVIPTATAVNLDEARRLSNVPFAASQNEPIQVAIVGQVNRPGAYTLTRSGSGTNAGGIPTVTQAIQLAGGITQLADIRNIEVRRSTQSGTVQTISINFWELLRSGDLRQDLPLQAGDTISIPVARALTPAELRELTVASFSPNEMTVNVVGEVVRPGAIALAPNTPLNQAILSAGGFNNRARRGSVQLIRLNPDGTVSRRDISVDFAQGANDDRNPALRPGDTIIVGRSTLAGASDVLGTILSPITGVFSIFRLLGL